ncbi:MAG TPA: hypothetical protein VKV26_07575 [Dehalococcoidia bacterium]|nr:hypothetical protein [Dehalococcoidia bacterium]
MRLRYGSLLVALITLACGGRHAGTTPATGITPAAGGARAAATAAPAASGRTAPASSSTIPAPVKAAAALRRQATAGASVSFVATLAVSLEGGGSYTYSYTANDVGIALDSDDTFDSTAPISAALALNANGCAWDLHLVNPQVEIAGSVTDDGGTLRIATIRVTQEDVRGSGACAADGGQSVRDFSGIGAGTTNLSPASPAAIPFSDGATASLPQPGAVDRYPRSAAVQWSGTLRLALPPAPGP